MLAELQLAADVKNFEKRTKFSALFMKEKPPSISVVLVEEEFQLKKEVIRRRRNIAHGTVHINFFNLPEDIRTNLPMQDSMVCKVIEPFYMSPRGPETRKYGALRQGDFNGNKPESYFKGEFQLRDLKLLGFGELEHNESNENRSTPVTIEITAMINAEDSPLLKLLSPVLTTHLECSPEALERLGRNKEGLKAILSRFLEIFEGRTFSFEFTGVEFRRAKQQSDTLQQTVEGSQDLSTSSVDLTITPMKDGEVSQASPSFSHGKGELIFPQTVELVEKDILEPPLKQSTEGSLKEIFEENFKEGVHKKTPNLVQTKLYLLSLPPLSVRDEILEVSQKGSCQQESEEQTTNEKKLKKIQGLTKTTVSINSVLAPSDLPISYVKSNQIPSKQAIRDYFREKSLMTMLKQTQPILLTVPTPSNQLSTSMDEIYETSSADKDRQVINKQVCKEYFRFRPDFYKKRLHYPTAKEWSDFTAQNNMVTTAKDTTDSEDSDTFASSSKKKIESPPSEELRQSVPTQSGGYIYRTYSPFSLNSCIYPGVNEKDQLGVLLSPPTLNKYSLDAGRETAGLFKPEDRDKSQSTLNKNYSNTQVNLDQALSHQFPKCSPTAHLRCLYKEQYYRWRSVSRFPHSISHSERCDNQSYSSNYPRFETPRCSRDWRNPRRP